MVWIITDADPALCHKTIDTSKMRTLVLRKLPLVLLFSKPYYKRKYEDKNSHFTNFVRNENDDLVKTPTLGGTPMSLQGPGKRESLIP